MLQPVHKCTCLLDVLAIKVDLAKLTPALVGVNYTAAKRQLDTYSQFLNASTLEGLEQLALTAYATLMDEPLAKQYVKTGKNPRAHHSCYESQIMLREAKTVMRRERLKAQQMVVHNANTRLGAKRLAAEAEAAAAAAAAAAANEQEAPSESSSSSSTGDGVWSVSPPPTPSPPQPEPEPEEERLARDDDELLEQPVRSRESAASSAAQAATTSQAASCSIQQAITIEQPATTIEQPAATSAAAATTAGLGRAQPDDSSSSSYFKRELRSTEAHKMYRSYDRTSVRMMIKCVWGPHDVATWEEADWLLDKYPKQVADYVDRLRANRPQAYRAFLTNFHRALDRIAEALAGLGAAAQVDDDDDDDEEEEE